MTGLAASAHPWTAWQSLASQWSSLHAQSPYGSCFSTAEWVDAWLNQFGGQLSPELLVFQDTAESTSSAPDAAPVAICVLVKRSERRGPFWIRRIYLHTAGEDEADECVAENNSLLCRAGREGDVAIALRRYIDRHPWDEFVAPALGEGPTRAALLSAFCDMPVLTSESPNYYVDLSALSTSADGYLETLSRNTREQIRRSMKSYAAEGPLTLEAPRDVAEAQQMLEELSVLHQRVWNARGKAGVFSSARFFAFHRAFIDRGFASGHIQLLRIRAGETVVGVLYNMVNGRTVSVYQTGLSLGDKKLKPGFVAHTLAIDHCRAAGFSEYEFLAGRDQYKQSLSRNVRTLAWLTVRNRTLRMHMLDGFQRLRKRVLEFRR